MRKNTKKKLQASHRLRRENQTQKRGESKRTRTEKGGPNHRSFTTGEHQLAEGKPSSRRRGTMQSFDATWRRVEGEWAVRIAVKASTTLLTSQSSAVLCWSSTARFLVRSLKKLPRREAQVRLQSTADLACFSAETWVRGAERHTSMERVAGESSQPNLLATKKTDTLQSSSRPCKARTMREHFGKIRGLTM